MNATPSRSKIRQGRLFLLSLRVAWGRLPLWGSVALLLAVLSLVVAQPWHHWFQSLDGHRLQTGEEFGSLSEVFRQDHSEALAGLRRSTQATAGVLAVLAWVIGIFVAGGWLQVILERSHSQMMRRFCMGGARHFLRFLRLSLLLLFVLGLVRWVLYSAPFESLVLRQGLSLPATDLQDGRTLESLGSEATKDHILWLRDAVMWVAFLLIMAWGIFTRARIAVAGSRSVLVAGGWTMMSMLRHPVRTLGPLLGIAVVEAFVLLAVLGPLARWINGGIEDSPGTGRVWMLAVLGLMALALREITRGARYHAAVVVSKATIRSSHHVDPWQSIGAPGGPQYPVNEEGDDRFGVSV